MAISYLKYNLSNGYFQNWLVAGPLVVPATQVPPATAAAAEDTAASIVGRFFEKDSGVTEPAVDLGPLGPVTQDNPLLVWHYYSCRDDHFVDLTTASAGWSYLRSWAYAQLNVAAAQDVRLVLTTHGPADVWLNGQHLHRQAQLNTTRPHSITIPATLMAGANEVLVRFESAGVKDMACVMALRVDGLAGEAEITLPTNIEAQFFEKRVWLEKLADQATLDRYVFGYPDGDHLNINEPVVVSFPDDLEGEGQLILRAQSLQGDIFQERTTACKPGLVVELIKKFPLRNGPHHLALWPPLEDYYVRQLRFERKELFHVVRTPYTHKASADAKLRAQEALEDAAQRRGDSLYSELAKMALGRWERIDRKIVDRAVQGIHDGQPGSLADLLGLLGIVLRFRKESHHLQTLGLSTGAFVTNFPCWRVEVVDPKICEGLSPDLMRLIIDRNHQSAPDHTTAQVSCAGVC